MWRLFGMRPTKRFEQDGRIFEVCYQQIGRKCQIWVFADQRPLGVHSTVSLYEAAAALSEGRDMVDRAMEQAVFDIETGRFHPTLQPAVAAE
jgi:hypothetical protein